MLKQAWRSYLASLHPRNIKKVKGSNADMLLYWTAIFPMVMLNLYKHEGMIFYMISKIFPFFIMCWSNITSRYLMTKQMFLCPMKVEERKKYVNYVLYLKIGVPVFIGLCIELAWSFIIGFNWLRTVTMVFIYISVGIALYICIDGTDWADIQVHMGTIGKNGKFKWAWMNVVSFIYGLLIMFGMEGTDFTKDMDMGSRIFVGVGLVVLAVLDICMICKQYKDVISQVTNYEESFHILGKVEKVNWNFLGQI